jgi:Fe-S-cluster-containing dehydrogenase component
MSKNPKRIFVFDELCNGCRLCEMQCSFIKDNTFNPKKSDILIAKVEKEGVFTPIVDCDSSGCINMELKMPECVRVCPTGALIYATLSEACSKRKELVKHRVVQPIFKVIAPWKWPYPSWREWPFETERER